MFCQPIQIYHTTYSVVSNMMGYVFISSIQVLERLSPSKLVERILHGVSDKQLWTIVYHITTSRASNDIVDELLIGIVVLKG